MDYRQLGHSGLKVSELSFGTATFGGGTEFFRGWGETDVNEAKRLLDICLEAGVNLFDTADIYSNGQSEEILGQAIAGKRQDLLISTKRHSGLVVDRTTLDRLAIIFFERARPACVAWVRITSTSTTCMVSMN